LAGKLFDIKGENIVVYPSIFLFAISLFALALAEKGFVLILASVFLAFGYGTFVSSMQALAVKVSPPHRIGLAISTFFVSVDIGIGIGPYFIGLLIPIVGFQVMYMLMGAIILCLIPAYYFLHVRKAKLLNYRLDHSKTTEV
jgi:MFS family permease